MRQVVGMLGFLPSWTYAAAGAAVVVYVAVVVYLERPR